MQKFNDFPSVVLGDETVRRILRRIGHPRELLEQVVLELANEKAVLQRELFELRQK